MDFYSRYSKQAIDLSFVPQCIALKSNNDLLITDDRNKGIWCLASNGTLIRFLDLKNNPKISRFDLKPVSMAVNPRNGHIYLGDHESPYSISILNCNGEIIREIRLPDSIAPVFSMSVNSAGHVAAVYENDESESLGLYNSRGKCMWVTYVDENELCEVTFVQDTLIAVAIVDDCESVIKIYNFQSQVVKIINGLLTVSSITSSPTGNIFICSSPQLPINNRSIFSTYKTNGECVETLLNYEADELDSIAIQSDLSFYGINKGLLELYRPKNLPVVSSKDSRKKLKNNRKVVEQ